MKNPTVPIMSITPKRNVTVDAKFINQNDTFINAIMIIIFTTKINTLPVGVCNSLFISVIYATKLVTLYHITKGKYKYFLS